MRDFLSATRCPALFAVLCCALPGLRVRAAEPLELVTPQATHFAGGLENFVRVVDGVETGPSGWSVEDGSSREQSLIVTCARPLEAQELDLSLFFLAGKPFNPLAEFSLSFTTDRTPSFQGKWRP